jgi:C4-dicarboxylate transporter DctM subunit
MGILIPPSIPMIIYAMVMSVSVTKQFLAGFLPGFVMGGAFIAYSFILSSRKGWRGKTEANWVEVKKAFKDGIWGLLLPVVVLGGIYSGIFTPTEASAVAVVAALAIELFVYRSVTLGHLPKIIRESAISASALLFIISAAGAMSWYMGIEEIPARAAEWIGASIHETWFFLLLVNLFLLLLGCFMDLVSALLILGPIFLPLLEKFQVDPLHFGIIMVINIEIGFLTPPFGINLFVSSGVMKEPLSTVARGILPFILLMFSILLVITYIPSISTYLPLLLR